MNKIKHMNECSWLLGLLLCALGVVLCTKADFGLSMVAAPAYIIHVFMRDFLPWYTQGTSEYIFQGLILILMCIVLRQFKKRYLLSFGTAVLAGLAVDMWLLVFGGNSPYTVLWVRILCFVIGELLIALAIAFFFRTDLPVQMYELAVCEFAEKHGLDKNKTKLWYDFIMLALALGLSFGLTHKLTGIGIGTVIITIVNAPLIAFFGKILDKIFVFDHLFPALDRKK